MTIEDYAVFSHTRGQIGPREKMIIRSLTTCTHLNSTSLGPSTRHSWLSNYSCRERCWDWSCFQTLQLVGIASLWQQSCSIRIHGVCQDPQNRTLRKLLDSIVVGHVPDCFGWWNSEHDAEAFNESLSGCWRVSTFGWCGVPATAKIWSSAAKRHCFASDCVQLLEDSL